MTEELRGCELCREHSGLQVQCKQLNNRCDHFENILKADGVVFTEIARVRKWMFWFWASFFFVWVANTGLTYKAANNTTKVAHEAATEALKLYRAYPGDH